MALPTTIASTKFPGANYYCGPFLSSGGNVYVVVLDTTNSKIHVYKATDPTSSFTEQDSANIPAQTLANTTNAVLWALQNGTVLSIAAGDGTTTPAYKFHQFSMATDAWDGTIKDKAILSPTLAAAGSTSISIVKRSDNSFVALLNGALEKAMGNSYDRVSYVTSTDGGATWSGETAVGTTGTKNTVVGSVAGLGASDRTHFFYSGSSIGFSQNHRHLSSANVLGTENSLGAQTITVHAFANGVAYVSGANTVVKIPLLSTPAKISSLAFNSGGSPNSGNVVIVSAATITVANSAPVTSMAVDATNVRLVWSDSASVDLYSDTQTDGGAWGTDVNEWTATINRVSANIYTRSGSKVLAVLVDDGGTVKYNEISLSSDQSYAVSGVFATG